MADPVKPEAAGVVDALQRAGLACHMLTGDNWTTARTVAAQLGIYNITAEVTDGVQLCLRLGQRAQPPVHAASCSGDVQMQMWLKCNHT